MNALAEVRPKFPPPPAPELAATLEVHYLRDVLRSLPEADRRALDVGAHRGDFTAALLELDYGVLAVEPNEVMADRFAHRHAAAISAARARLARCAASDKPGRGQLLIGSASTVSTLEPAWTQRAFPEEFQSPRSADVTLKPLAALIQEENFGHVGFAKIDVEGHELAALTGLLIPGRQPPAIVMFEANARFPEDALACLTLLKSRGYATFDIFIRIGIDPIAGERFHRDALPHCWTACGDRYFYSNIIAYHQSVLTPLTSSGRTPLNLPDPAAFVVDYQLASARGVLETALAEESVCPAPIHPVWEEARLKLRDHLLHADWRDFLQNPICRNMFVRGRWSKTQDVELAQLRASRIGRRLLQTLRDPSIGAPRFAHELPGISTNLLAMCWYLSRIAEGPDDALPDNVIEIGGGYGAMAFAYAKTCPDVSYTIIDLPEMLALQHFFLTLALPDRPVVYSGGQAEQKAGQITLVPIGSIDAASLAADLLISTFALSEMPRSLQLQIERRGYFGVKRLFVTGQLSTEFPTMGLERHGDVVGAVMQRFAQVRIERLHVGDNYLLVGQSPVKEAA